MLYTLLYKFLGIVCSRILLSNSKAMTIRKLRPLGATYSVTLGILFLKTFVVFLEL